MIRRYPKHAAPLFGGLQKTETLTALNSMNVTTRPINTRMDESENSSLAPERRSSLEQPAETACSYGESSLTTAGKTESTAPSSETRASTGAATSFDRRMRLLIACGLIAGITPSSVRQRSNQLTLDIAFSWQDGEDAAGLNLACSFSKDPHHDKAQQQRAGTQSAT